MMKKSIVAILTLCILVSTFVFALPALAAEEEHPHDYKANAEKSIAATCTVKGVEYAECECGKVQLTIKPATGHKFTEGTDWVFDSANKQHKRTCDDCGEVVENCEFSTATNDATCSKEGTVKYTCKICNGSYTEEKATLAHDYKCTMNEEKTAHTAKCTFPDCEAAIESTECVFVEDTNTATCTEAGTKTSVCVCGNTKTEDSAATGHILSKYFEKDGKHYAICTNTNCMKTVEGACEYEYTAKNGKHIGTCKVCGTKTVEADCTVEKFTVVEGKQEHKGECTVCKNEVVKACDIKWTADEAEGSMKHTGECSVCTAKFEATDCKAAAFTASEDGKTHTAKCVCGREISHEAAVAAEWTIDAKENKHSRICTAEGCDYKEEHKGDFAAWEYVKAEAGTEAADKHAAECKVCKTLVSAECTFEYVPYEAEKADTENTVIPVKQHQAVCTVCKNAKDPVTCGSNGYKMDTENEKNKAATCTEPGYQVYVCSDCNQEIQTSDSETPATGHSKAKDAKPVEGKTVSDKDGHALTYVCDVCKKEFAEEKTAHTFSEVSAVKGKKEHSKKCTVCGYEVTEACTEEDIPAVAPTCSKDGSKDGKQCKVCKQELVKPTKVDKDETMHVVVEDKAVAATCSKEGLTAGSHCSECNKVLKKQEKVEKLAHTEVKDKDVAATCTKAGKKGGSHCSVCNEVIELPLDIEAKGHDFQFSHSDATCDKAGNYYYKCSKCGEETKAEGLKAPATGKHKFELVKYVEATAEEDGYKLYQCTATGCNQTKTIKVVYNVNTGASAVLAGAAGMVLMAGAAFLVSRNCKKKNNEETAA